MLILKEVKEAKQDHQRRKAKKAAFEYSKKLIADGWYQIPVEGAVFSKNGLAIYYHLRDPYSGQMKRYKFSENKEEDKLLEQQYQQFIQKYMDDFVIWDLEAEWIKENMERTQKYNEYINAHANDIITYVDQYFNNSKDKMKQDILNMIKNHAQTQFMNTEKISLNETIHFFLEHEYAGNDTAALEIKCGYPCLTYGDVLEDKVARYVYDKIKQLIKRYLEDYLKENITDYEFKKIEDESFCFEIILDNSVVMKFNDCNFVFEFVGINDQLTLKELI